MTSSPNLRRRETDSRFEEALLSSGTRRLIVTPELAQDSQAVTPIAMQSQRGRPTRMSLSWSMDMIPWVNDKTRQRSFTRSSEDRLNSMASLFDFQHRPSLTPDLRSSSGESSFQGQSFPHFRPYVSPALTADSGNSPEYALEMQSPASLSPNQGWQGSDYGPLSASYFSLDSFSPSSMGMSSRLARTEVGSLLGRPAARLSFSAEELPMLSHPIDPVSKNVSYPWKETKAAMKIPNEHPTTLEDSNQETAEKLAATCWNQDESSLDLKQMATELGGDDPMAVQARSLYMRRLDLRHRSPVAALRLLASHLYLNAETNRIDNILQALAVEYVKANPSTVLQNEENVHSVLFALFLLNTDLHIAELDTKMSQVDFVQNVSQNLKPESIQVDREVVAALQQMYCSIRSGMLEVPSRIAKEVNEAPRRPSLQRALSQGREGKNTVFPQGDHSLKPQRHNSLLRLARKTQRRNSVPATLSSSHHDEKRLGTRVHYQSVKNAESMQGLQKPQNSYYAFLENEHIVLQRDDSINEAGVCVRKIPLVHSLSKGHYESDQSFVSITLHDGTICLLHMDDSQVDTWTSSCNQTAAQISRVPMVEGASNCDYGWLQVQLRHYVSNTPMNSARPTSPHKSWWRSWLGDSQDLTSEEVKLQEWHPPPISLEPSSTGKLEQKFKVQQYIKYLQQEIKAHDTVRAPMLQLWKNQHRALMKATANWDKRHAFLTLQLEKFELYMKTLSECN